MICNSSKPNAQKLKFASDKRIPAVTATWLWDCISRGSLQSYSGYQLNIAELQQPQKPRTKIRASADTPILPREDEGNTSRQGRRQPAKVATKPQRLQRPRALDLARSADATPESTVDPLANLDTSTNSYTFDHEPVVPGYDGPASQPLQDISANSPRRPSLESLGSKPVSRHRSSSAESLIRAVPAPKTKRNGKAPAPPAPDSVIPADPAPPLPPPQKEPEEEKDYSDMLAKLRANRKAAPTPAEQANGKRPRRQLGRATSTRSNQSTGDVSSGNINLDDEDESTVLIEEYQPSQELGWDSPGAAKAREQMIKKLGGTIKERSVPVQGIGIVKDVGGDSVGRSSRRRG
jgi:DNA replication regulator DPB11